jgi:hypothetical protein
VQVIQYEALHRVLRRLLASLRAHERFQQPAPLRDAVEAGAGLQLPGCDASARCGIL